MSRLTDNTNVWKFMEVIEVGNALAGKRIVFTGHMSLPRPKLKDIVEKAGGKAEDNITHGVDYLVTNNDWTPGSVNGSKSNKFKKARFLMIKIISEQEFIDMIVSNSPSQDSSAI